MVTAFISKHFLPIGTLLIIPLGIIFPSPAVYLQGKLPVVKICIVTLFFVIGMKFRLTEIHSALRCYKETALGLIIVLFATPVVGTKLMMLPNFQKVQWSDLHAENITLNNSWSIELPDFGPEEFRIGLQIFCVSPCASAFPTVVVSIILKCKMDYVQMYRSFILSRILPRFRLSSKNGAFARKTWEFNREMIYAAPILLN